MDFTKWTLHLVQSSPFRKVQNGTFSLKFVIFLNSLYGLYILSSPVHFVKSIVNKNFLKNKNVILWIGILMYCENAKSFLAKFQVFSIENVFFQKKIKYVK